MLNHWIELIVVSIGACCIQWLIYTLTVFLVGGRMMVDPTDRPKLEPVSEALPETDQVELRLAETDGSEPLSCYFAKDARLAVDDPGWTAEVVDAAQSQLSYSA
jgi:hypothetical protein